MKRAALILLCLLAWTQTNAQTAVSAASTQAERARIAAQRRQELARYSQEEKDCAERFFVNDCVADVKTHRRAALAELRRLEIELDEIERSRKAARQAELMQAGSASASSESSGSQAAERLQRKSQEKLQAQMQNETAAQVRAQEQTRKLEKRADSDAEQAVQAGIAKKNARAYQEKRAAAEKHKADLHARQQGQTKAPAKALPDPP